MMKYPEGPNDPRATVPGLAWTCTRARVAQLTSFGAMKAGDLAEEDMKKTGIDWVSFEGRRFDYWTRKPGEHYRLIAAAMCQKVRQNLGVKKVQLSTGDLMLRPDHHQKNPMPLRRGAISTFGCRSAPNSSAKRSNHQSD